MEASPTQGSQDDATKQAEEEAFRQARRELFDYLLANLRRKNREFFAARARAKEAVEQPDE